ncbi:hypothetical protein ACRAWG_24835 [Methylobacterium sp. P31]
MHGIVRSAHSAAAPPIVTDPRRRSGVSADDAPGFITADWLAQNTPMKEAIYYLCGPRPFLRSLVDSLARTGAPLGRIHFEFFGSADELLAA